jgi:hypothetical protein
MRAPAPSGATLRPVSDMFLLWNPGSGTRQVERRHDPSPTRQYARLVSEWIASIGLDPLQSNRGVCGYGEKISEIASTRVDVPEDCCWRTCLRMSCCRLATGSSS